MLASFLLISFRKNVKCVELSFDTGPDQNTFFLFYQLTHTALQNLLVKLSDFKYENIILSFWFIQTNTLNLLSMLKLTRRSHSFHLCV